MPDPNLILSGAGLAVALIQVAKHEITRYKELQKYYARRLSALRKEVHNNLETVNDLLKKDTGAQAVYNPAVRKPLNTLRYTELKQAANDFEPILGKALKKAAKKSPSKKDPLRIFWDIYDTARKLEDLSTRLKKIHSKPTAGAPRLILKRRYLALQKRLADIDEALKIIPVKQKKNGDRHLRRPGRAGMP